MPDHLACAQHPAVLLLVRPDATPCTTPLPHVVCSGATCSPRRRANCSTTAPWLMLLSLTTLLPHSWHHQPLQHRAAATSAGLLWLRTTPQGASCCRRIRTMALLHYVLCKAWAFPTASHPEVTQRQRLVHPESCVLQVASRSWHTLRIDPHRPRRALHSAICGSKNFWQLQEGRRQHLVSFSAHSPS